MIYDCITSTIKALHSQQCFDHVLVVLWNYFKIWELYSFKSNIKIGISLFEVGYELSVKCTQRYIILYILLQLI